MDRETEKKEPKEEKKKEPEPKEQKEDKEEEKSESKEEKKEAPQEKNKEEPEEKKRDEASEPNNATEASGQSSQETKQVDLTEGSKPGVEEPSLIDYKQPEYPERMKKREIEGKVVLKVLIDYEGQVDEITVRKSSGYKQLDLAAKKAAKEWRFNPARKEHQKIGSWILVPIRFRLEA